ncbi:dihydroxyacetone kinase subunit DhaL [Spiribacter onubensis]|uniref:Dihydroxyacetone kinase subunit DhaL n=1 Tax=Spiribacter onubensis TaxID=3122420 RepID=A0ABV3S6Z2_9GAMM
MSGVSNANNAPIIRDIAECIVTNKAYLSEIDGRIGDGDHGNNMAKGFAMAEERISDDDSLADGLSILSNVLMTEIGGSMGPLYGMMFEDMAEAISDQPVIDATQFQRMLEAGQQAVISIGSARVGDKTLLDTLCPATDAFASTPGSFQARLEAMKAAAAEGRDSTRDMIARVGRSSRLGERSRGVLDAGATSCCMILCTLADGIIRRLA